MKSQTPFLRDRGVAPYLVYSVDKDLSVTPSQVADRVDCFNAREDRLDR